MYDRFEEMTGKLSPTLRRIAHRMNGRFTFFSDDDLYQEAIIHLWVQFNKGTLDDKTDSYILQGCYFHLKNYLRTTLDKVRPASLDEPADEGETALEDTIPSKSADCRDPVDEHLLAEEMDRKGVTEREREVLRLLMEGLTVREVGAELGVSHVMIVKIRARIQEKCADLKKMGCQGYHS